MKSKVLCSILFLIINVQVTHSNIDQIAITTKSLYSGINLNVTGYFKQDIPIMEYYDAGKKITFESEIVATDFVIDHSVDFKTGKFTKVRDESERTTKVIYLDNVIDNEEKLMIFNKRLKEGPYVLQIRGSDYQSQNYGSYR